MRIFAAVSGNTLTLSSEVEAGRDPKQDEALGSGRVYGLEMRMGSVVTVRASGHDIPADAVSISDNALFISLSHIGLSLSKAFPITVTFDSVSTTPTDMFF